MSELSVGQLKGLPVNNNVVTVPSGHALYAPGHVVQVVSFSTTTTGNYNASSWNASPILASITPKYASSNILVTVTTNVETPQSVQFYGSIFRGTTAGVNLGNGNTGFGGIRSSAAGTLDTAYVAQVLDSPNTTSSQQYTFAVYTVNGTAYIHGLNGKSTITLMEIAA